jgi:hypothetical protein
MQTFVPRGLHWLVVQKEHKLSNLQTVTGLGELPEHFGLRFRSKRIIIGKKNGQKPSTLGWNDEPGNPDEENAATY